MVMEHNPRFIIQNLLKLLKPGGYLQWDELDCIKIVKKIDALLSAPALEKI